MKRNSMTLLLAAAMMLIGVQTAKAQKVVLHMAGNQKAEYDISQLDSINFVEVDSSGEIPSTDPSVTGDAIDITNKSATLVGYATSIRESLANDLRVGFIYCLEGTPNKNNGTQVTVNKNDVADDGRYMAMIENLLSETTYYFRSFVYQSGLWFYGKVKSFVTAGVDVNFTTGDATDITCFSAKVSGSVDVQSSYSSLTYGICYGTNIEPTTNDKTQTASSNNFTLQLRQLTGGTIYYYRPYAIVDGQTYYGTVRTFRTLDDNVVETGTIDEETLTVTSHLTIGGGAYSSLVLGVCYGKTELPTINDFTVTSDEVDEDNNYTVRLINPNDGIIYYRAYVLIDDVPHYGKVKNFVKDTNINSLWHLIKKNSNYSRFASIAQKAKYYRDSTTPVDDYTYKDILNGSQVNTVWIPNNDAFTEKEYEKWLQMCETDGYRVHQQFMGNHISLWRHNISGDGVEIVKMVNGKSLILDKTAHTLQGIPLGADFNKQAANGVMHVLQGVAPFRYNFYEYLKYSEPQTKLGKYVVSKDTTYFNPSASIEGLPDENGNPTYVDSVFLTTNRLFEYTSFLPNNDSDSWLMAEKGFGARINNEDSVFIMLMPTDEAWDEAYERLKGSHKYAALYEDKSKGDLNSIAYLNIPVDSLQKKSIEMDIISPLVFNIHKQPKVGGEMWTQEMFKTYKGNGCEYLLNTFGDTLRNVGEWDKTSLFDGELKEMSNGLAYEVASWNFPKQYYTPDIEVEIENTGIFYNTQSNKFNIGTTSKRYSFSNDAYKDITNKYGRVSNNNFYHLAAPTATSGPKVEIKLYGNSLNTYVPNAQVMSGKYDIQIVVVPHWYIDIAKGSETDFMDDENANSVAANNKYKFKATLSYNNNASKDKTLSSSIFEYDGLRVDTLTIFEDFEFPYSYKNMRFTYPTLYIEGATTINDSKNGFVYDFVIDKIILKRKD